MRYTLPRLVRKNSRLSLWSFFIKGMMVQLGATARFRTAYHTDGEAVSLPTPHSALSSSPRWPAAPTPGRLGAHL